MLKNKSFTLIEMVVVMAIFTLILGAVLGIFVSAIRAQRYNLVSHQLLNQTSYAMEYISRFLRMAKKDDIGCIDGSNYQETRTGKGIKFVNYNGECLEFFWGLNNQLKVNGRKEDGTVIFDAVDLTSDDFEIISLNFHISGDESGDDLQPRVTMYLDIKGKGSGNQPEVKIQTTVSQRNPDI